MITERKFKEATGHHPTYDDLERCNCLCAGQLGHEMCGWDDVRNKPKFWGIVPTETPFMAAIREGYGLTPIYSNVLDELPSYGGVWSEDTLPPVDRTGWHWSETEQKWVMGEGIAQTDTPAETPEERNERIWAEIQKAARG